MSSHDKHMDDALLIQFVSGEANADQIRQVMAWMELSEDNKTYVDQMQDIWLKTAELEIVPLEVDTESAWSKVNEKISRQNAEKMIPFRSNSLLRYAAIFIAVLGGIWMAQKFWSERPPERIKSGELVLKNTLTDGSLIALNANSELSYTDEFNKKKREVRLKGEAFFEVKKDSEKEFIVHASETFITVIGTSFNIKNIQSDSIVEVSVLEGTVRFSHINLNEDTISILLKATDKAQFSLVSKEFIKTKEPLDLFWLDHTLVFEKTELNQVFTTLEEIFKTKIEVEEESINALILSATFRDNSLEDILSVISATFNLNYSLDEGAYFISKSVNNE